MPKIPNQNYETEIFDLIVSKHTIFQGLVNWFLKCDWSRPVAFRHISTSTYLLHNYSRFYATVKEISGKISHILKPRFDLKGKNGRQNKIPLFLETFPYPIGDRQRATRVSSIWTDRVKAMYKRHKVLQWYILRAAITNPPENQKTAAEFVFVSSRFWKKTISLAREPWRMNQRCDHMYCKQRTKRREGRKTYICCYKPETRKK